MSLFGEFSFFCVLAVVLTIAFVFGVLEKKQYPLLLLFSILFDVLAIGRDLKGLLFFGGYILWELLVSTVYLKQRQKQGRNGRTYALFLVLSLLPLVLSKICGAAYVSLFQILGISYLTFKSAQVIIEIYDGVIKELSLPDMAQFLLFFPAVSSGPIDRSRRFTEDLHRNRSRQEYLELAGDGLEQLLIVAFDLTIDEVFQAADDFGGIAFPAHIDRDSYSIVSNLGGIPDNLDVHILELSANCDAESFFDNYPGLREYPVLRDSDAHYLWDMSERCNYISTDIQISGAESLIQLLKGPSDQYEIGIEPQTPVI